MNSASIREKGVKAHEKGAGRSQKLTSQAGTRKQTARFAHFRTHKGIAGASLLAEIIGNILIVMFNS